MATISMEDLQQNLLFKTRENEEEEEDDEVALQKHSFTHRHLHNNNDNDDDDISNENENTEHFDNENGDESETPITTNNNGIPKTSSVGVDSEADIEVSPLHSDSPVNDVKKEEESGGEFHNSVYFDQQDGAASNNGVSAVNGSDVKLSKLEMDATGQEILAMEFNHQHGEKLVNNGISGSSKTSVEESNGKHDPHPKVFNSENGKAEDSEIIEDIEVGDTDFDMERVIEKQNTHDLFCPNCHSCITRKVILRRRKIRYVRRKPKPVKSETDPKPEMAAISSEQGSDAAQIVSRDGQTLPADVQSAGSPSTGGDREVFRCLSCFSFFIPTGSGFKLFRWFGKGHEGENVQTPSEVPSTDTRGSSTISTTNDSKTGTVKDKRQSSIPHPNKPVDAGKPAEYIDSSLNEKRQSTIPRPVNPVDAGKPAEYNVSSSTLQNGAATDVSSTSKVDQLQLNEDKTFNKPMVNEQHDQYGTPSIFQGTVLPSQVLSVGVAANNKPSKHEDRKDELSISTPGTSVLDDLKTDVGKKLDLVDKDRVKDVIITIKTTSMETASSQIIQATGASQDSTNLLGSVIETRIDEESVTVVQENYGIDIVKSIVYGGLVETITSVGIVSSAAGAGTATLNILGLALANLIGGLFILVHNLVDLKNDDSRRVSNDVNEQEDRYQKTLGRREHFPLHATVVILSFLIFGLLPPVLYAFAFRKSDDKDLKLAVAGGVSFVCIVLLAIGKAYTQRPPKFYLKTILYFASVGLAAAGASYVAGELIKRLLEKLGLFASGSDAIVSVPEIKPFEHAWASY